MKKCIKLGRGRFIEAIFHEFGAVLTYNGCNHSMYYDLDNYF
jgi:hypothetical protein